MEAPVAHELEWVLVLQRSQLMDAAGLDQLAELGLDAGADAAQLAHTPVADQARNGQWSRAHELGRSRVRAHGERAPLGELEQRRELR